MDISLREIINEDLKYFFEFEKDKEANNMAAFMSRDPNNWEEFKKHWNKNLSNELNYGQTIIYNETVVGYMASYMMFENREVGYWIDKNYWGKGIATTALKLFLEIIKQRPLFAHVAFDNFGSIKVLEKCGFNKIGEDKYFAKARNMEIKEYIFKIE